MAHGVNAVNIKVASGRGAKRPYHHGGLRTALVDGGVQLAREGGPEAIVLREAARRIGVSPTAAYRHFASLPELVEAVSQVASGLMTDAMEAELAAVPRRRERSRRAVERLQAVGRGYVRFALAEPGLFATSFGRGSAITEVVAGPDEARSPATVMRSALDDLVAEGMLDSSEVGEAFLFAWSTVHGLSALLLGTRPAMAAPEQAATIDAVIARAVHGLVR